ncbi:MAG: VOC family protein [Leptolyngbyaceae cyanobacterium MAG.088]|nr:VOC family protein [Leptolyngbyaceae cyanobacterium MAG.088]
MSPRAQTLLAVKDVLKSSKWYANLLQLEMLSRTKAETHGNTYNRLLSNGEVVLQLHSWDDEEHPNLIDARRCVVGHGVLVWFEIDDFEQAIARAKKLKADVVVAAHINPGPNHWELWLRDPDGYHVVLSSPDGEV